MALHHAHSIGETSQREAEAARTLLRAVPGLRYVHVKPEARFSRSCTPAVLREMCAFEGDGMLIERYLKVFARTIGIEFEDKFPNGSDEALFAIRREEKRREVRRATMFRVVSGLVLALLVALAVNAYRSRGGSADGQVATADDIGIKIAGAGAADPGRSEAVIRHGVEQHFAELQQDYLTALQADSNAEGVMTLHMTVAADGTVAYVRSTPLGLADRGFVTIVERQAAAWRFVPSQLGLVSVHYPLVFHLPKTDPQELVTRLRESSKPEASGDRRILQATQLNARAGP